MKKQRNKQRSNTPEAEWLKLSERLGQVLTISGHEVREHCKKVARARGSTPISELRYIWKRLRDGKPRRVTNEMASAVGGLEDYDAILSLTRAAGKALRSGGRIESAADVLVDDFIRQREGATAHEDRGGMIQTARAAKSPPARIESEALGPDAAHAEGIMMEAPKGVSAAP